MLSAQDTKIRCTYLEVYNENLVDLLYTADGKPPPLKLAEDPTRGTVCHNLTEVEVTDTEQVMTLLMDAQHRCHVGETAMNERSNRAHRIFTLLVSFTRAGGDVVRVRGVQPVCHGCQCLSVCSVPSVPVVLSASFCPWLWLWLWVCVVLP